jgi:YggT family protein
MFVLGNLIYALATILDYLLTIINWMIIIRALLSWVNPDPYNALVRFLYKMTEPLLAPFRRIVPLYSIG